MYIDVSCILCRSLDQICFRELEDPHSPWEMFLMEIQCRPEPGQIINCFIACLRGNPFVKHCTSMRRQSSQPSLMSRQGMTYIANYGKIARIKKAYTPTL